MPDEASDGGGTIAAGCTITQIEKEFPIHIISHHNLISGKDTSDLCGLVQRSPFDI